MSLLSTRIVAVTQTIKFGNESMMDEERLD